MLGEVTVVGAQRENPSEQETRRGRRAGRGDPESEARRGGVAAEVKRRAPSMVMAAAASTSSSAAPAAPRHAPLDSKVHQLEVACAELKSLHETRAVYEKRGAIFFRTTVKAAAKSQQKELEKAKASAKKAAL